MQWGFDDAAWYRRLGDHVGVGNGVSNESTAEFYQEQIINRRRSSIWTQITISGLPGKKYKGAEFFFVTCCLSSFNVEVSSPHELHISGHHSFSLTLTFLIYSNCY
jgi:hypothetical protein